MSEPSLPTHIVFMGTSTHLGGAERSLLDFLKEFSSDRRDIQCSVLFPKAEGPLIDELQQLQIPVFCIKWPQLFLKSSRSHRLSIIKAALIDGPLLLFYFIKLILFLKKHKVTHLHTTGIKCHVLACFVSLFLNLKITIHWRDRLESPFLKRFFCFFSFRKTIVWLSASKYIQSTAPELPMHTIYDGFDTQVFKPQRNTFLKKQLQMPFGSPLVGLVGVIARWKGQKEFIQAAHKVIQAVPRVHFVIVGDRIYDTQSDNDFFEELQSLCKELKVTDRIHFVKFQKHPEIIYNGLDILVHCSTSPEPFGRVIVEAMLCQTPVIASDAGGVLEIVENNVTGFLHTPGDVRDLARKMRNCLLKESLQNPVAKAYEYAQNSFNFKTQYLKQKAVFIRSSNTTEKLLLD